MLVKKGFRGYIRESLFLAEKFMRKLLIYFCVLCFTLMISNTVRGQHLYTNFIYRFDREEVTEPASINAPPEVDLPGEARKNGVEGTVKGEAVLGENGQVRDVVIKESLPFGVSDAVMKGVQKIYFQPAKLNGKTIPVKMTFDYIITATYDEGDNNVEKPKILQKPEAVYPENQRTAELKGSVLVGVGFYADGTIKILSVSSTMPKEFDKAAVEAAKNIKFQPAIHKKSKKPVSQGMTVEYKFKP